MPKKKVLASDDTTESLSKFENISISDLSDIDDSTSPSEDDVLVFDGTNYVPQPGSGLGPSDWVDPQEIDNRNIVVEDKEEVRRADIYMENGATLTVNYGGSVYVTDGITNYQSSGGGSSASPANSIQLSDGSGAFSAANWTISSNHILPSANDSYDIGSASYKVRDLYLGPNSLNIAKTGSSSDFLTISAKGGEVSNSGDLIVTAVPETGHAQSKTNYYFENSGSTTNLTTELAIRGGPSASQNYLKFKTDQSMTQGITLKFPTGPSTTAGQYLSVAAGSSGENVFLQWTTPSSSGIENVVEDTTPQLGGDLDVNGQSIVTTSNGNISLSPNGSGEVQISSNLRMDDTDMLGVRNVRFYREVSSFGPLITDTDFGRRILLEPKGGTSPNGNPNAVNSVQIGNIGAVHTAVDDGRGTNLSKIEAGNGYSLMLASNAFANTSYFQINPNIDITDTQSNTREGIELRLREDATSIASVAIKSINLNSSNGVSATSSPQLRFYNPDNYYVSMRAPDDGALLADVNFILPVSDGSTNQVLKTNGAGQLGWTDQSSSGITSVIEDTTPQLGGDLDLNSSDITGTGNIDITGDVTATLVKSNLEGAIYFSAQAGENLVKGEAIYVSGLSGNIPIVMKARANSLTTMPAFGIASENITFNTVGNITTLGVETGLNVSNFGETGVSFSLGDTLYISSSEAGKITNVAPTGETNFIQNIGRLERATPTNNISIRVGGAGRSNAAPALNNGNIFIGDSSNRAVTSNFQSLVESYSINNIIEDTSPQLGANLDLNSNDINGTGNIDITGGISASGDIKGSTHFVENGIYEEYASLSSGYTDKVTFDCSNKHIFVLFNLDRNISANFTNLQFPSGTGRVTSVTLIINQGSTAYVANTMRIDDVVQTIEWQGNLVPSGTPNGVDVISFSIIYDGSTGYIVLGQLVDFG